MGVDLDKGLVASILRDGPDALKVVREFGIDGSLLVDPGRKLFDFVEHYFRQYGQLPTPELLVSKFEKGSLPDVKDPIEYFILEIRGRKLQNDLKGRVYPFMKMLEDGQKPFEALDELDILIRGLRQAHEITRAQAESVPKLWPEVMDLYDRVKGGEKGILTPWPTVNNETLGFWPEDLALFAARLGIGKCVAEDTEIVDPETGVPHTIHEVCEREDLRKVFTWSKERGVHAARITAKVDTGVKPCLRFRFASGREVTVTPEHPFLTSAGWEPAADLVVGASVGLPARVPFPESPEQLLPEAVDLLALLLAEGSYSGKHVGVSSDDDVLLSIASRASDAFGVDLKYRSGVDYDFVRREKSGPNHVRTFLRSHDMDGKKAVDKIIPEAVFGLPSDQLARFLGLFWMCDGYVDGTGPGVTLASEKMVQQLQHLLLRFGIHSSVDPKKATCEGRVFNAWRLRVYASSWPVFLAAIPLWGSKRERLEELESLDRNPNIGFPRVSGEFKAHLLGLVRKRENHGKLKQVGERLGWSSYFMFRSLFGKGDTLLLRRFAVFCEVFGLEREFGWLWDSEIFWDSVESIEDVGPTKIYDLTVEPSACFLANDVIVHNTWAAAIIAHHAWAVGGHKVLFGTTEISKIRIAMRFAAIHFKLPYREIRLGKLDAFNEKKMRDGIKDIMDAEGLYVIGGDFDFRVESYENAVEEVAPELSILDGAYLLKTQGQTRTERAANAFDELKRICKRTKCPSIVTMQFNREVKAGSKATADAGNIALTDVAGWNADLAYGLIQSEDMKKDRRMIFKPLKVREGEGEEFEVNWDIDKVNFTELPKLGGGGGGADDDDDPFGAGVNGTGASSGGSDEVPF